MAAVWRFLASRLGLTLLGSLALAAVAAWAAHALRAEGVEQCEQSHLAAAARDQQDAAAHLAVVQARADALSTALAERERQYSNLRAEYLTYANAIVGNCPAALGVLIQSAAAAQPLPASPGAPADPAAAAGAARIAANVAENYTRAWDCIARYNALLDWHAGAKEAVKP